MKTRTFGWLIAIACYGCTESEQVVVETDDPAPSTMAAPIAETTYGAVRGAVEDGINVFKGIRYGADTATTRFQ